jgi:hypothetical protein
MLVKYLSPALSDKAVLMRVYMALMQEVDIWSFGCFIFEMLTLHRPYQGLPDSEIYDLIKVRPLHQKQPLALLVAGDF